MKENDWQLMRYFLLSYVLTFMVALSLYGIFRTWEKICKFCCYKFFAIVSFALLPSSRFALHVFFRLLCQTTIIEIPSLNRYEKVACEKFGNQIAKLNLARHKKSCFVGTLCCTQCPNFFTKSQIDLKNHNSKKHSAPKLDVTFKCKLCYQEFPGFHVLLQHRNTQHGMQIGPGTKDVDMEHTVGDVEERRVAFLSISVWWIRNLKGRDTKYSITQCKLSTKQSWTRNLTIFSAIWNVQQK